MVGDGGLETGDGGLVVGDGGLVVEDGGLETGDGGLVEDLVSEVAYALANGSDGIRSEVEFVSYDFDDDGFVDYVEWVVPHLSSQVYEIIYITKAEHLDVNRSFVEDVYDSVKAQDGNWSPVISDGEFVRVTFEVPLDSSKDVTIWARGYCNESVLINGTEVPCEIYWKKVRVDEIRRGLG